MLLHGIFWTDLCISYCKVACIYSYPGIFSTLQGIGFKMPGLSGFDLQDEPAKRNLNTYYFHFPKKISLDKQKAPSQL